jgi:hypothetical protein
MKTIQKLLLCFLLSALLCMNSAAEAEQPETSIEYTHYADPAGDVFAYMCTSNLDMLRGINSDLVSGAMRLASVATGELFVEYECSAGGFVIFSPTGEHVAKIIGNSKEEETTFELALCTTSDDTELWRTRMTGEGETPPIHFTWDYERDWLISITSTMPDIDKENVEDADYSGIGDEPVTATINVVRISDGSLISKRSMNVLFDETMDFMMYLPYGGGKLFLPFKDDPFKSERDTSGLVEDIYVIEPVTWAVDKINLRGLWGEYSGAKLIATQDGGRLFFQPGVSDPEKTRMVLSNDIIMIDVETGEWEYILERGENYAYGLQGITPDGSRICCVKQIKEPEKDRRYEPFVYDLVTEEIFYIVPALKEKIAVVYQISHSGRYVVEWTMGTDIWAHDIETGERKVIASSTLWKTAVLYPGIPGNWNSW